MSLTTPTPSPLPDPASAYYSTRAEARSATWRTARGPIAVAALELQRLGWTWHAPFQLADHDGTLRTVTLDAWEQRQHPHEVCYVDGACYPHVIPSLARAGWAGVCGTPLSSPLA